MNEMSWLIYAADVAGSINGFAFFGGGVAIAAGAACLMEAAHRECPAAEWDSAVRDHGRYPNICKMPAGERPAKYRWSVGRAVRGPLVALGVCVAVAIVTPARETLYAVAASEMGERVLTSETGGKAVEALNAWLERQINKPAPEAGQ